VVLVLLEELAHLHQEASLVGTVERPIQCNAHGLADFVFEVAVDDLALLRLNQLDQVAQAAAQVLQHRQRDVLPIRLGLHLGNELQLLRHHRDIGKLFELGRNPDDAGL
jgi:hypothetical protein